MELKYLFTDENKALWYVVYPPTPVTEDLSSSRKPTSSPLATEDLSSCPTSSSLATEDLSSCPTSSPLATEDLSSCPTSSPRPSTATPQRAGARPPSSSTYEVFTMFELAKGEKDLVTSLIDKVKESTQKLFDDPSYLHNTSFWTTFFNSLFFELSGGLMVRQGRVQSEAEVKHELIVPLLRRIAHSMSMVYAPDSLNGRSLCESTLNVEFQTEKKAHKRGPKPRVDYALAGHIEDKLLYRIFVEIKKKMKKKDMAQLAQYMSHGGKGELIGSNATVGFLIDESYLRLAFSTISSNKIPLPIVIFSPPLEWRKGMVVNRGVCVVMCLLQQYQMKREELTADNLLKYFGNDKWKCIKDTADDIASEEQITSDEHRGLYDYFKELRDKVIALESQVADLTKHNNSESLLAEAPLRKRRRKQ